MNATVCPINPPGHDWEAGLSCRWCDATRTPGEAVLSGLASVRGWSREAARAVRDAHRAEVLNEAADLFERAGRIVLDGGIMTAAEFADKLRELAATGEQATAAAATATPTDTNRRARLLHEMALGGRWKSGDVVAWYQREGLTDLGVATARRDLATLRDSGAITQHDAKGVRFYTLQKGGTR